VYFRTLVKIHSSVLFAILVALILSGCAETLWNTDDSHYVSLGPRNGYYIVRPGSQLYGQLDLYDAPWIDTSSRLRHGYGADVLAFRFNRAGILIAPPAYVAQESANDFYTRRIGKLVRGHSTTRDVEATFGRGPSTADRADGFMYYYALPVYNAAEDWGGRR
jgi:hypothetical protein